MKKKLLLICLLFLTLGATGCASNELTVKIKNVQETEISFVVPNNTFSYETISKLKENDFDISEQSEDVKIGATVSNIQLADNVNKKFANLLTILKDNDTVIYDEIKNYSFSIESSFDGYPFGAIESINLATKNIDSDFKVKIIGQDIISLNNGTLASDIVITGSDLNKSAFISYNMSSIKNLKISIEPKKDYKSIDVFFKIDSKNPILNDMKASGYVEQGFTVENQNESSLTLSKHYENTQMFNYVFNMDMINYFGIVGKVDVNYGLNVMKSVNVNATFSESKLIDDVQIAVVLPKKGTDSISKNKDTKFSWNLKQSINADITSKVPNYSTIFIVLVSIIGISFVFLGTMILKKRVGNVKFK